MIGKMAKRTGAKTRSGCLEALAQLQKNAAVLKTPKIKPKNKNNANDHQNEVGFYGAGLHVA